MNDSVRATRRRLLPAVILLLLVGAAYQRAPLGGFVWDDHALIEHQPVVQQPAPLGVYFERTFWSDPLSPGSAFYRPLITLSYALEWRAWKGSAAGFHFTNVLAHLAVCLLLFQLCWRLTLAAIPSAAVALLFGLFPRLTESVSWISGRTDVFAALFALAALLVVTQRTLSFARAVAASALIGMGLLCKEVALAAVPALFLVAWRAPRRERVQLFLGVAVAVVAYAALRVNATTESVDVGAVRGALPFAQRLVASVAAVGEYGRMVVGPLRPELQIGAIEAPRPLMVALGAVIIVAVAALLVVARRKLSLNQWAGIAAAVAALLMVLHIVPLDSNVLAADRYLYFPLLFLAFALAPLAEKGWARRPRVFAVVCAVAALSFAAATFVRTSTWNDEYALWREAVDTRDPRNSRPLLGLSGLLMDHDLHARALPYLRRAVEEERAAPSLETFNALAFALDKTGGRREAIGLLEKMRADVPDALRARLNLALAYARDGRFDDADAELDSVSGAAPALLGPKRAAASLREARSLRVEAERLPAGSVERAVAEASLHEALGAAPEAEQRWNDVLAHPSASTDQLLRAAGYFAFHAEPDAARHAIERAAKRGVTESQLAPLENAVNERDRLR